jgi:hypothetical protein
VKGAARLSGPDHSDVERRKDIRLLCHCVGERSAPLYIIQKLTDAGLKATRSAWVGELGERPVKGDTGAQKGRELAREQQ